jgi:hypothetical protein
MNMRSHLIILMGLIVSLLFSCENDILEDETVNTDAQWLEDIQIITDYINDNGFSYDTTTNGVRYTILDSGSGKSVNPNDIVAFHYTGRLTTDTLFRSTIDTVLINTDSYDEDAVYPPTHYTYTTDGWNIPSVYNYAFETGYREGVSKVIGLMKEGGHAKIMIPSELAYQGNQVTTYYDYLPAYSVIVFDIYLVTVD